MDRIEDEHEERRKHDIPTYDVAAPTGQPDINKEFQEETAAEFGAVSSVSYVPRKSSVADEGTDHVVEEAGGTALGWVSLVFAIASWFLWPVLMGATSAVLGFIAYRQGAKGLGAWAMGIGLIAVALALVIVPFYYAVT